MGEIPFDRPDTRRLEIDEARRPVDEQEVVWMRGAMNQFGTVRGKGRPQLR